MNEQSHPSRRGILGWVQTLSILVLGIAAGAALIYLLQPPKPIPTQVIYSVYLIRSDTPHADFRNEARDVLVGFKPARPIAAHWSLYGSMSSSWNWGAPANFTFELPDSSGGKIWREPLSFDFETTETNQGIRTKFGFLKGSTRTEHWFDLKKGDLRVIELMSVKEPQPNHYYAVVQMLVVYPRPTSLSPFKRPRTMTIPRTGMSK